MARGIDPTAIVGGSMVVNRRPQRKQATVPVIVTYSAVHNPVFKAYLELMGHDAQVATPMF